MTAVLAWTAPPPDGRTTAPKGGRSERRDYAAIARQLRERAGEWALVAECPGRSGALIARRMRRGVSAGFQPAGAFEAECREAGAVTRVYARYVVAGGSP